MMANRADLGRLTEGQIVSNVDLSRAEAAALNATRLVSVEPAAEGWTVRAAYAVGALRCGTLDVRVQPKVGSVQVLRLLARADGVRALELAADLVGVTEVSDLTSVLAAMFTAEAATALADGPMRGYRSEDQTGAVVRGRLRLRDQELRRYGQLMPIEVTVDEWTTDTDENRRLRVAARRLLLSNVPPLVRRRLVRIDRQLADVRPLPIGAVVPAWTPTRLNARLHPLLRLADLVLSGSTVEHRVGQVQVRGFVLSMATLFERLATRLLRDQAREVAILDQVSLPLDDDALLTIRPDLIVRRGHEVVAVADMKYKLLDTNGLFPNADAYQLLTYALRLGLASGHLIYAAGDRWPPHLRLVDNDLALHIHVLDLGQPLAAIEDQVKRILAAIVT
jgi:5-methylcytosine-specific restriction enzyme subunit McrC